MYFRQLLRMKKWARHPPSAGRVKLVLGVIAVCLALYALDRAFGLSAVFGLQPPHTGRLLR